MRRQINLLSQGHLALLQGTFEVHIPELFAEIGGLLDQGDETVFNHKRDISALLHPFRQVATGIDRESLATVIKNQSIVLHPTLYGIGTASTYGRGGLGNKSTDSICRILSEGSKQYSNGLSPLTGKLSI
jgi:hypothetical protein